MRMKMTPSFWKSRRKIIIFYNIFSLPLFSEKLLRIWDKKRGEKYNATPGAADHEMWSVSVYIFKEKKVKLRNGNEEEGENEHQFVDGDLLLLLLYPFLGKREERTKSIIQYSYTWCEMMSGKKISSRQELKDYYPLMLIIIMMVII